MVENVWLWSVTEKNWQTLLEKNVWASWNNNKIRKLVKSGDKVVFYIKGTLQIQGIFTFTSDWYDAKKPIWYDEVNKIKYPSQIKIKPVKTGIADIRNLIPKLKIFQKVPLSKSGKLKQAHSLILKPGSRGFPSNNTKPLSSEDYKIILEELQKIPFEVNGFYNKNTIWRTLKVGAQGGIRINKKENFAVVFFDAPTSKPIDKSRNIYTDYYDSVKNLFHYTGEGRTGNQKLSKGNRALVNAKKNKMTIHLFRQYEQKGPHEYIGKVNVVRQTNGIQKDVNGKKRKVFVFWLKPISNVSVLEETVKEREEQFEFESSEESGLTIEELAKQAEELNRQIKTSGPKKRLTSKKKIKLEEKRNRKMVILMKKIFKKKCQVCNIPHFETKKSVYSEVHHLIPWEKTHDDTKENLVVVCPTCHKKFDHGKEDIKISMYKRLCKKFPQISYNVPSYIR